MHLEHFQAVFPGDTTPSTHTAVYFDPSEQGWRQALQDWARLGSVPYEEGNFPDRLVFPSDYDVDMIQRIISRSPSGCWRLTEDVPPNQYV